MASYSPLKTLCIKNFQSIADATIELGKLTVLCGAGDAGKSAILRALRAACLNEGHDDDIRHGTSRCEVELTFEDGMSIIWSKEKGKGGSYRMGYSGMLATEYNKTGGQVPEAIAEYLGVGLIRIDSTTELTPQLSDQHDLPFILWESGSKRARILGKATRLDVVVSAQMACKKELDQANRGVTEATDSLAVVEQQLAALPDYTAIEKDCDAAEANLQTLTDNILLAVRARELASKISEVHSRATAIDVDSLRTVTYTAAEALERAARIQHLADRIPELQQEMKGLAGQKTDQIGRIGGLQAKLLEHCKKAGICVDCGGLLSHKECTP